MARATAQIWGIGGSRAVSPPRTLPGRLYLSSALRTTQPSEARPAETLQAVIPRACIKSAPNVHVEHPHVRLIHP